MNVYPLGLKLDRLPVLVVGGGQVAQRRVPALIDAGADVTVVSPEVTPAIEALPIRWIKRGFEPADLDGMWLVQATSNDPAVNAAVSAAAEERRIFCVRADDRTAATAWTPAITRHGRITVAVLSGGHPRLSMAVRDAIRDGLAAGRLIADVPANVDREAEAASTDAAPPASPGATALRGVALVGAGPGDPELITVYGRRLLAEADVVVVDRLAPGMLLDGLRPDVELIDAAKIPYGRQAPQDEINKVLIDRARAGKFVVRLKGGDPYVFGRGGEEVLACTAAGIPVTVVPGVTSAVSVPAAAGIPVTYRGVAHEFTVVSGHLPPDHPESLVDWSALARLRGTLVLLMAVENLPAIVEALVAGGRSADTPAAAVAEGTTARQRVALGTLGTIAAETAAAGIRPPAIVVIGDVATVLPRPAD